MAHESQSNGKQNEHEPLLELDDGMSFGGSFTMGQMKSNRNEMKAWAEGTEENNPQANPDGFIKEKRDELMRWIRGESGKDMDK
jgi:hypothetical protein